MPVVGDYRDRFEDQMYRRILYLLKYTHPTGMLHLYELVNTTMACTVRSEDFRREIEQLIKNLERDGFIRITTANPEDPLCHFVRDKV